MKRRFGGHRKGRAWRAAKRQGASRMASSHWSQERGAARCPPQSPRANPTNTSILDFQLPELREKHFCRLRVSISGLCYGSPRKLTHPSFIHDPHAPGTQLGPACRWLSEDQEAGSEGGWGVRVHPQISHWPLGVEGMGLCSREGLPVL